MKVKLPILAQNYLILGDFYQWSSDKSCMNYFSAADFSIAGWQAFFAIFMLHSKYLVLFVYLFIYM